MVKTIGEIVKYYRKKTWIDASGTFRNIGIQSYVLNRKN